jgi:hypothetical protein
MLHSVFFILYLVTNCDAFAEILRCDWRFAIFNTGIVCLFVGISMIRHYREPVPKRRADGSLEENTARSRIRG